MTTCPHFAMHIPQCIWGDEILKDLQLSFLLIIYPVDHSNSQKPLSLLTKPCPHVYIPTTCNQRHTVVFLINHLPSRPLQFPKNPHLYSLNYVHICLHPNNLHSKPLGAQPLSISMLTSIVNLILELSKSLLALLLQS